MTATWLLITTATIAVAVIALRFVGRIASLRLTLAVLAIAIGVVTGVVDPDPLLAELTHAITHLFGAPQ
jgi:hypothetical protein